MSVAIISEALRGAQGELVLVRIATDARQLEELLEAVAELPFPVNPEIHHQGAGSLVEFPAYSNQLGHIRQSLHAKGLSNAAITHQIVTAALSA